MLPFLFMVAIGIDTPDAGMPTPQRAELISGKTNSQRISIGTNASRQNYMNKEFAASLSGNAP